MHLLDTLKAKLAPAKEKVSDLAHHHEDKIDKLEHGLDKVAKAVDEKTKGKYSDKIHTGTDKAKGAMDRFVHKSGAEPGEGAATPPEAPPPAS
ncbi:MULTISPECIES: antitoxin [Streptomyces]|uniref:antitoxin n=1 Tax=Streptomyces TaxID=1883 RepID=UPI00292FA839|nr:antitoxin [Streptomyces sp. NEAU-HV9]